MEGCPLCWVILPKLLVFPPKLPKPKLEEGAVVEEPRFEKDKLLLVPNPPVLLVPSPPVPLKDNPEFVVVVVLLPNPSGVVVDWLPNAEGVEVGFVAPPKPNPLVPVVVLAGV